MTISIIPIDDNPQSAEALFELTHSNRTYLSQWLNWLDCTQMPNDSQAFLKSSLAYIDKGIEPNYFIRVNDKLAGTIVLREITKGLIKTEANKTAGIIGYWLGQEYTGQGVTTEALKQLINDIKFRNIKNKFIDILILKANPDNIGSNRVAQKNGFKFQFIEPKAEKLNGELCDLNIYYLEMV